MGTSKSGVVDTFKAFMVAAVSELQNPLRGIMRDNACELSMGDLCNDKGIKLSTITLYDAASNTAAECTIRGLTRAWGGIVYHAHELSMGDLRNFCDDKGIKLSTITPYDAASNRAAERTIGGLPVHACCAPDYNLPYYLWAEALAWQHMSTIVQL